MNERTKNTIAVQNYLHTNIVCNAVTSNTLNDCKIYIDR